jgi:hypothetical protein
MHDLLIVLKPFSIYDPRYGRKDLRPGARINLDPDLAEMYVRSGHLERIVAAAPLFVQSTDAPKKPMKQKKEPKLGDRSLQPDDVGKSQELSRDQRLDG